MKFKGGGDGLSINPAITAAFGSFTTAASSNQTLLLGVLGIVVAIGVFIWYARTQRLFETKGNITRVSRELTQAQVDYALQNPKRKGLRDYLRSLQASGVDASHIGISNFYVSSVNAAGIFYPRYNGVASTEAARAAVLAGARGFVFDLWPDLSAGAGFTPIVQVVEEGSLWRRISLNSESFAAILRALMTEAFEIGARPGSEDPLFLYLRFRGKPRAETFEAAAAALRGTIEKYRLPASYNGGRASDRIFSEPVTNFFRRVIVFSNQMGEGTSLVDSVNIGPSAGIPVEYPYADVRGASDTIKTEMIKTTKQHLVWMAPNSESADAEANSYSFTAAQDAGIQFVGMNFWNKNDKLKAYMDPKMFGTYSFAIKPPALRFKLEFIPDPKQPVNPDWGKGAEAGKMRDPPALKIPI